MSEAPAAKSGEQALVRRLCAEAENLLLHDRFDEAREKANQALRLDPRHAAAVHILGVIEMESGDPEKAIPLIKRSAALDPTAHEPYFYLGRTLEHLGRFEEAASAFRKALEIEPGLLPVLEHLGTTLQSMGRLEEAGQLLREAIARDPARLASYRTLADLDASALTAEEVAMLERVFTDPAEEPGRVISSGFTLAAILDKRGDYDAAFAHLKRANDMARDLLIAGKGELPAGMVEPGGKLPRRADPRQALAEIARAASFIETTYTPEFLARYRGFGHPSRLPVFVLGMPRSGSTLIEQIIASHPHGHGAGEIDTAAKTLAGMNWPNWGYRVPGPDGAMRPTEPPKPPNRYFRELGAAYVKALRRFHPKAERIVNKMPGNYYHIGQIELCLPHATILHSVRDPVDNCLGFYRVPFATGNETSYDLGLIGRHYQLYRRIMEHWRRVLPGRVVDVVYEELVADPERQIRRLIEACGLPWNDACLRFYDSQRPVKTASVSQVRRPIYQTAVQRWKRYEKHLGPLFEALGPYAPAGPQEG